MDGTAAFGGTVTLSEGESRQFDDPPENDAADTLTMTTETLGAEHE